MVHWDIVPLHMSLMTNGKIFAWGKTDVADTMGMPRIWDPAAGPPSGLPAIHVDDMLFCAGLALMPDGRLMLSGGHHQDDAGIKTTYFFSADGVPDKGPDMANGRWYPTVTVLEDGRVLTMAGRNEAKTVVRTPEIWESGAWHELPGAGTLEIPYYPRNFVDPKNGLDLLRQRAGPVALVQRGWDRRRRWPRQLERGPIAHLWLQPGLRLRGHVRRGEDPGGGGSGEQQLAHA